MKKQKNKKYNKDVGALIAKCENTEQQLSTQIYEILSIVDMLESSKNKKIEEQKEKEK